MIVPTPCVATIKVDLPRQIPKPKKTPKGSHPAGSVTAHRSQLGDRHLGGFHEGNHFAANDQFKFLDRASGDDGGDDTRGGLYVDLGQHVAGDNFLDGAFELVADVDGFDSHGVASCVRSVPNAACARINWPNATAWAGVMTVRVQAGCRVATARG